MKVSQEATSDRLLVQSRKVHHQVLTRVPLFGLRKQFGVMSFQPSTKTSELVRRDSLRQQPIFLHLLWNFFDKAIGDFLC